MGINSPDKCFLFQGNILDDAAGRNGLGLSLAEFELGFGIPAGSGDQHGFAPHDMHFRLAVQIGFDPEFSPQIDDFGIGGTDRKADGTLRNGRIKTPVVQLDLIFFLSFESNPSAIKTQPSVSSLLPPL